MAKKTTKSTTNVEMRGGNEKLTGLNRKIVLEAITSQFVADERARAKAKKHDEKYGTGKYIDEGIIARIYGEYLVDLSKLSELDRTSFEYGYYDAAVRQLAIMISNNKISDFIKSALNRKAKFAKDEDIELYIKEILYQIGYRDSYDSNFEINELPEIIKNNEDYVDGFEQGLHEQYNRRR